VQRFVKAWREERRHGVGTVFIPQSFAPGEAYQFDGKRPRFPVLSFV